MLKTHRGSFEKHPRLMRAMMAWVVDPVFGPCGAYMAAMSAWLTSVDRQIWALSFGLDGWNRLG
jgi:hypothetical protein